MKLLTGPKKYYAYILALALLITVCFISYRVINSPKNPLDMASVYLNQGKAALAIDILEKLAKNNPQNFNLLPYLALSYLRCDRLAEARTALDTALKLDLDTPFLTKVILEFARYYELKHDFNEAENLLLDASIDDESKELDSQKGLLYYNWAQNDLLQNNYDLAIKHLNEASQYKASLANNIKQNINVKLAYCYRNLGLICQIKENNINKAIDFFERSLSYNNDPLSHYDLANLYLQIKNINKAQENYRIVVKDDPNNLAALQKLIDLLVDQKDYKLAKENLVKLLEKEKCVENYLKLAKINLALDNYPGAVKAYEDAVSLKPRLDILIKLHEVLLDWANQLQAHHNSRQANSVKGHALRINDEIAKLTKEEEKKLESSAANLTQANVPINIVSSKIWLAKGSLTPEAEIKIQNTSSFDILDINLQAYFYDNTLKKNYGCVSLPIVNYQSMKFLKGSYKTLYFSCPNTINPDNKVSVIIFWKNHLLKEFPINKEN